MSTATRYPASEKLRNLGLKRQSDLAQAGGKTQGWLSHQLNGRRGFTPHLEAVIRSFLLGRGFDPAAIEQEITNLRELAGLER